MTNEEFRHWLIERYATIAGLNGAWRTHYGSFDEVDPPGSPGSPGSPGRLSHRDQLPRALDWLTFCDAVAFGEDRPEDDLFNELPRRPEVMGDGRARRFALAYEHARMLSRQRLADGRKRSARAVLERVLAGLAQSPASGDDAAALERFVLRAAMMHGAAIEADEASGWLPQERELGHRLIAEQVQVDRKLLLLYPRIYAHLRTIFAAGAGAGGAGGGDDGEIDLGFQRQVHIEGPALFRKLLDLTDRCGFPWEAADTRLPLESLLDYALVVCPTLELLDRESMRRIDEFVTRHRGYAAIGPRVPIVNELLRGERTLARHFAGGLSEFAQEIHRVGDGAFFTLPGYMSAATIEFICFESGLARGLTATQRRPTAMQPELTAVDEDLDVVVHRNRGRRIVFVANPTGLPRTADLTREPVRRLTRLSSAGSGDDGATGAADAIGPMRVTAPPYEIMVFIAE